MQWVFISSFTSLKAEASAGRYLFERRGEGFRTAKRLLLFELRKCKAFGQVLGLP
jgi:hypothetical protein